MNPIFSKRIAALLIGAVLATAGCSGDSSTTTTLPGTITGTVKKGTAPVAGVVVAPNPANGPSVVTDSSGKYRLVVLPGSYSLSFTGDNLEPATASATVAAGETVTVDQTMAASALTVTVTLPPALRNGGPAGFDTEVTGINAAATLNGEAVASPNVTWTIKEYYGLADPPAPATPNPESGTTTSFSILDFETVREGANAWLNARYGLVTDEEKIEYIQTPARHGLLSFGTQQVRAMSFLVKATVRVGSRTATGSAVVSPVTISSGGNTQPLGMMVVANAPEADTYAWQLQYLPATAVAGTPWGAPPEGVALQAADTKNPYLVPTVAGVYKLANGTNELLFRVSTYHGSGQADTDVGTDGVACVNCHNGDHGDHWLTSEFAEWRSSAHANHNWKDPFAEPMTLLEFGLRGLDGAGYNANCISCHTVGYSKVPTAANKGFDDIAAASDPAWTFPSPLGDAAWATVENNPGLKYRAGMQCESCHGPLEPTDHGSVGYVNNVQMAINYGTVAPGASLDSGVCNVCHDAFTHHDRSALWAASKHADVDLAILDATVENRPVSYTASSGSVSGVAHCGRCHGGEGYLLYLEQQQGGGCTPDLALDDSARAGYIRYRPVNTDGTLGACTNITSAANATAANAYFAKQGLTVANVHSTTCQTCHDPHSTELRVTGDTKVTAGMFRVTNAGAGAQCFICHNSRGGSVRQGTATLSDWTAPHVASQGDVFAGRNAFFVTALTAGQAATDLPKLSKHAFMAETCADCHVKWVPEDIKGQYKVWNTNHTFKASREVCAECHAPNIGEMVAEQTEEKLHRLGNLIGVTIRTKINTAGFDVDSFGSWEGAGGAAAPTDKTVAAGQVVGVELTEASGGPAVRLTLVDGSKFTVRMSRIYTPDTTTAMLPVSGNAQTMTLAKAFYNYLFIHGDGTEGMHNPAFVREVLDSTITAMTGLTIP